MNSNDSVEAEETALLDVVEAAATLFLNVGYSESDILEMFRHRIAMAAEEKQRTDWKALDAAMNTIGKDDK